VLVIGALIAWVSLDYRAQRRTLADLELQGFTRGSGMPRAERVADAKEAAKEQA
jgi:hypothetical protein